jgi:RHS repeat-associated protein
MVRNFLRAAAAVVTTQFIALNIYAQVLPSAYSAGKKVSYVRTWDASAPEQNDSVLTTRLLKDVRQTTAYVDGFGMPLQTVIKEGSLISGGTATDLVSPFIYDEFDRERYKFLPFAANSTGSNTSISDGGFKLNPFQQQAVFAAAQYPGETYYYCKTNFEPSPLNRPVDAYAPGNSWVGSESLTESSRRRTQVLYFNNTATDSVRVWNVTNVSNAFGTYTSPSAYAAGELVKSISVDEHGKQVVEFKDKLGQIVLKKVQLAATVDDGSGRGHYGWLCTYYIYDDMRLLRAVLQPVAVEEIASGWSLTTDILNELCFRYEYDKRNRMITKKVPGAAEVYMVYDAKDRLVLTQDGNLHSQNKWIYNSYDDLNRLISTGLWPSSQSHSYHLAAAYSATAYPELTGTQEETSAIFYDDYAWVIDILGSPYSSGRSTTDDASFATTSNAIWPYPQSLTHSTATKGMVTGIRNRVLGTSQFIYSINYYDAKGRVVQVQTKNITGGRDILTTQYTFSGQVLQTVLRHEKAGTNSQTHVVQTRITYDDAGRPIKSEKKLNSTIGSVNLSEDWHTTTALAYDALGQLKKKTLGPDYSATALDTLSNIYNIRGWLTSINKGYVEETYDAWFGMELGYDQDGYATFSNKQYNGNISGTTWRTRGDGEKRKYEFVYDAANRLLKADFTQKAGSAWNVSAGLDFSMKMGDGINATTAYDANGNIKKMWQRGWKLGGSITIDSLIYKTYDGSNKLKYVRDGANDPLTLLGDFKESNQNNSDNSGSNTADYTYDVNGNLTVDNNKSISSITYNQLNLPAVISVTDKGSIDYVYDASGTKLKKIVHETNRPDKTTLYIAGFVYQNDSLELIQNEEGRLRLSVNSANAYNGYAFDYFEKDHLGNVRIMLTEQKDTAAYTEASTETGNLGRDTALYSNVNESRIAIANVAGYPSNDTYTNPNDWTAKTSGSGNKIGPGIVLKVMTGDKFNFRVSSWYKTNGASPNSPVSPLTDIVTALIAGIAGGGKYGVSELQSSTALSPNVTSFLNTRTYTTGRPKAYLNWILLDERLNFDSASSGFLQVPDESVYGNSGTTPSVYNHIQNGIVAEKSGYLYLYVSNETPNIDVFFDNLQVTHFKGPLLEETGYYPFGLTMVGISSKAAGGTQNRYKYNGIEQNNDFDLNMYDAFYRNFDSQLGRSWQIDPKPNMAESPYTAMGNNPILKADFLGDTAIVFGRDGKFLRFQDDGRKAFSGKMIKDVKSKTTIDANGNVVVTAKVKYSKFSLNDGALVAQAIKNGVINKVEMVSDAKIEQQMDRSGVKTDAARSAAITYASNQGTAGGLMDYAIQGAAAGDLNRNTLYVTGGVGYDIADFGNFLFGRGMAELGVSLVTTQLGAQYNHIFNNRFRGTDAAPIFDLGPGTYDPNNPGWFDSGSDQRAMANGYSSSPAVVRAYQKTLQLISTHMRNWRPNRN